MDLSFITPAAFLACSCLRILFESFWYIFEFAQWEAPCGSLWIKLCQIDKFDKDKEQARQIQGATATGPEGLEGPHLPSIFGPASAWSRNPMDATSDQQEPSSSAVLQLHWLLEKKGHEVHKHGGTISISWYPFFSSSFRKWIVDKSKQAVLIEDPNLLGHCAVAVSIWPHLLCQIIWLQVHQSNW